MSIRGKKIVVTRDAKQAKPFIKKLTDLGAHVFAFPTITITYTENTNQIRTDLKNFDQYDWIIFTSANAVESFFKIFEAKDYKLDKINIASVGKKTAEALEEFNYSPDLIPPEFTNAGLITELYKFDLEKKSILLPVSNLAPPDLENALRAKGAYVRRIEVYETKTNQNPLKDDLHQEITANQVDCITFFSPSALKSFVDLMGNNIITDLSHRNIPIAVIGPATEKAARELDLEVAIQPEMSDSESLIQAMVEHFASME